MTWTRRVCLIGFLVILVGGLAWFWLRSRAHVSVTVAVDAFANWPLIVSNGTDPWIVAIAPPDQLMATLSTEATRRAGRALFATAHPGLPLVLRTEFDEGLQGVYGTDSVLRMAHEAELDSTRLEPICLAHHAGSGSAGPAEVYFVAFESAAFSQLRIDLTPTEPEHAGIGVYDPGTLTPILIIGATDQNVDRWWPLRFDQATDCVGVVAAAASGQH